MATSVVIISHHPRRKPLVSRREKLTSFISHSSALFCIHQKLNSFLFKRFRTLLQKHPGVGHLFAASLTSHETLLRKNRLCKSPVFSLLPTLPSSVSRKPFACHSYENCRVCTNNSHSGTRGLWVFGSRTFRFPSLATGHGTQVTASQCRKCRIPVNTIAKPSRSAAAITSASRTEPPGWITAVAPALAASSTPSGNGKNASEATTLPASGDCAFITAIFTESTRLICPAPTPSVAPSFANTIALDFTCFATFHAKRIVRLSSTVGTRFVTVRNSQSLISPRSGCCTSIPPRMRFNCSSRSGSKPHGGSSSKRRFFFAAKTALAFSSNPGAAMHSTKSFATSSAVAASTTRLNASTPPNAETGSHASAFKYASRRAACSAVPQGLLCLMITATGLENSAARLRAASRSTKLLYESSFPWSCFAAASPSGFRPAGTC